jgi:signal transduction histidine kinase
MLHAQALAKNLALVIDNQVPDDQALLGDTTRLQQALLNYLSNAIKFTPRGQITVRARVEHMADTSALLRFEVQDTGEGIAPPRTWPGCSAPLSN